MATLQQAQASRKYGEDLVGGWERGHFDTQRGIANDIYNTNLNSLLNQYSNLTQRLEQQRDQRNRDVSSGLGSILENSITGANATQQNLANRGLSVSGVQDLAQQAGTQQTGNQVADLLRGASDAATLDIQTLAQGGQELTGAENDLNRILGDTLGEIGADDLGSQMQYNQLVAGLANSKDNRDAANAQAAASRASAGKTKEEQELEEFYRLSGILEVLNNEEMDEVLQNAALQILFDVENADAVRNAFSQNSNATQNYEDALKAFQDTQRRENTDMLNNLTREATAEERLLDNLIKTQNGANADTVTALLGELARTNGSDESRAQILEYLNTLFNPASPNQGLMDFGVNNGLSRQPNRNNQSIVDVDSLLQAFNNYQQNPRDFLIQDRYNNYLGQQAQQAIPGLEYQELANLLQFFQR